MIDFQSSSNKFVCATCLEDEPLREFANQNGEQRRCDYCGKVPKTLSVVPLDAIIKIMEKAIAEEWCDPVETSPVDGGEYILPTIDSEELLFRIGFEVSNEKLMDDVVDAFGDHDWCEANWEVLPPSHRWKRGWERFRHVVMHQRRYTFWYCNEDAEDPSHPDYLPPSQMLGELQALINGSKMVKQEPVGTLVWRVRSHPSKEKLQTPSDFTPPPVARANQPNRMSPAGVPMFYGAIDFPTAFLEVFDPVDKGKGMAITGTQFKTLVPLNLLDLTAIPSMPSYFGPDGPFNRHIIQFLRNFTEDLSKPIQRNGHPHVEYVPTQVFTEFVRYIMKGPDGISIHGIKYPSSKNRRTCYVLFASQDACLPAKNRHGPSQLLEFVSGTIRSLPIR